MALDSWMNSQVNKLRIPDDTLLAVLAHLQELNPDRSASIAGFW